MAPLKGWDSRKPKEARTLRLGERVRRSSLKPLPGVADPCKDHGAGSRLRQAGEAGERGGGRGCCEHHSKGQSGRRVQHAAGSRRRLDHYQELGEATRKRLQALVKTLRNGFAPLSSQEMLQYLESNAT